MKEATKIRLLRIFILFGCSIAAVSCTKEVQKPPKRLVISLIKASKGSNNGSTCKSLSLSISGDSVVSVSERPFINFRYDLGTVYGVFKKEAHAISGKEMIKGGTTYEVDEKDIKVGITESMFFSTDTVEIESIRTQGRINSVSGYVREIINSFPELKKTDAISDGYYFSLLNETDTSIISSDKYGKLYGKHSLLRAAGYTTETNFTTHLPVWLTPKLGYFTKSEYSYVSGAAHGFTVTKNEMIGLLNPNWTTGSHFADTISLNKYSPKGTKLKEVQEKVIQMAKCGCFNDVPVQLDSIEQLKILRACENFKNGESKAIDTKPNFLGLMGDPAKDKPIFSTIQIERLKGRMTACFAAAYDACYACSDGDYDLEASYPVHYFTQDETGAPNESVKDWNALSITYPGLKDVMVINTEYRLIWHTLFPLKYADELTYLPNTELILQNQVSGKMIWKKTLGGFESPVAAQER